MPTRESAPLGAPCWTDLWASDVEGSRKFYSDLFGWEAQEPSPEFGGYFSGCFCGVCTMYTILAPGSPMPPRGWFCRLREWGQFRRCLLYTSDAADEEDSVDLGGRRIIKKKKRRSM